MFKSSETGRQTYLAAPVGGGCNSVEDVFYGIKPVLASGYIAALGYLGVLATRWVWVVTLAEVTEAKNKNETNDRSDQKWV